MARNESDGQEQLQVELGNGACFGGNTERPINMGNKGDRCWKVTAYY